MADGFSSGFRRAKFLLAWNILKFFPGGYRTPAKLAQRVLVVPPDPWDLTGSRGDEAMIQAVIDKFSAAMPHRLHLGIVVATERAAAAARGLGVEPLLVWGAFMPTSRAILKFNADAAVVIGADCMDGFYSPETSSRLVATADILARRGVPVAFTGFSFNDKPSPFVVRAFNQLASAVQVNLRDPVSLGRFQRATRCPAHLVADVAFLLNPAVDSERLSTVKTWVAQQRAAGAPVIAFNVHPHLVKGGSPQDLQALIGASSRALARVLAETQVSVLLLAHDYRERDGDGNCLGGIYEALRESYGPRVLYPAGPYSASELKEIASLMDGVITGRMHLAIASLGMGVPVSAFAYQGKFNGLLKHFNYPENMQISAADALSEDKVHALITRFLQSLAELTVVTQTALPAVKKLSLNNLRAFLAPQ